MFSLHFVKWGLITKDLQPLFLPRCSSTRPPKKKALSYQTLASELSPMPGTSDDVCSTINSKQATYHCKAIGVETTLQKEFHDGVS